LGLGAGRAPAEILEMYLANVGRIFPRHGPLTRARAIVRAKYRPDGLRDVLIETFGDLTLRDSVVPLVVPSFNLAENTVYLFKTPHHPRLRRDHDVPMWQVAMATTAAPTFFPAFELPGEHVRLIDGGVWANNPAMVGVAEAVSMFDQPLSAIRLLSLGTTIDAARRPRRLDHGGLLQWVRSPNVAQVLLAGQSAGAFTQAQHLLGGEQTARLNPLAPDSLTRLDAADARDLIARASHYSRDFAPRFAQLFGSHRAASYAPSAPEHSVEVSS
jgi:patatin-like phospholipase/acyl hydrolase